MGLVTYDGHTYTRSGTPCSSCDTLHGCDNIPNGNCGACAHPRQTCVMDANSHRLCGYTRGHIGWADLFVETTTADEQWAGTDDDVWIDIGDREFVLDTPITTTASATTAKVTRCGCQACNGATSSAS